MNLLCPALASQNAQYSWRLGVVSFGLRWHLEWQVSPVLGKGVASAPATNSPESVVTLLELLSDVTNRNRRPREHPVVKYESEENPHGTGVCGPEGQEATKDSGGFPMDAWALGCVVESLREGTSGWHYKDKGSSLP